MSETYRLFTSASTQTVPLERRQEPRVQTTIHSELTGIDRTGRLFTTEIEIEETNDLGCRFESSAPLDAGDIVAISRMEPDAAGPENGDPQLFEITWTRRRVAFWTIGAMKLQGEKLAQTNFPIARISSKHSSK